MRTLNYAWMVSDRVLQLAGCGVPHESWDEPSKYLCVLNDVREEGRSVFFKV